ncbi:MAG: hypothetical protein Q8R47_01020 [Nanoarchaeota archaeon]|nr:hypothetical protein [Nanoarchaeota archaeon]
MSTRFLLDPRVLDDYVSDSAPDVEVAADAVAYYKHKYSGFPSYYFYLNRSTYVPPSLLRFPHSEVNARLMRTLIYQRAHLNFIQLKSADRQRQQALERDLSVGSKKFEALYAFGKFLKGDAQTLKNYGVTIKPQ